MPKGIPEFRDGGILVQAAGANPSRSNLLRSAAFVAFTGLGWEGLSILV